MSADFLGNAQNFRVHLQTFFCMATTLMPAIDQIMGLCLKITCCKNHDILFGQCENAYIINFLCGGQPNGTA